MVKCHFSSRATLTSSGDGGGVSSGSSVDVTVVGEADKAEGGVEAATGSCGDMLCTAAMKR